MTREPISGRANGRGRWAVRSPGVRLLVLGCALAMVTAACGNRIKDEGATADQAGALNSADGSPSRAAPAEVEGAVPTPEATVRQSEPGEAPSASRPPVGSPTTATSTVSQGRAAATSRASGGAASSAMGERGAAPQPLPTPKGGPAVSPGTTCSGQLSPVVIGSVSTMSGVAGEVVRRGPETVRSWVSTVNAKGGLQCHPVKYLVADDGADPNRHQALVQTMVERDHVIAFVYNTAPLSGYSSVEYIDRAKIPVIGNEGGSAWFYKSPYFFPQGLSGGREFSEMFFGSLALSPFGKGNSKVAAISCVEAPACSGLNGDAEAMAKKYNLDLVYNAQATLTQPDYTSHCLAAQSAGAEAVLLSIDGNSIHRFARSCESVGFKPTYVTVLASVLTEYAKDRTFDGLIGGVQGPGWFLNNPATQEFRDSLRINAPGLEPSPQTLSGWTAAKLFEAAAQRVPEPPTAQAILDGLWAMQNNELGGLTQPLTFVRGQVSKPYKCFWAVAVQKGQWVGGDQRICPS